MIRSCSFSTYCGPLHCDNRVTVCGMGSYARKRMQTCIVKGDPNGYKKILFHCSPGFGDNLF